MFHRRHAIYCFLILIWLATNAWSAEPNLVGVWKFVKEVDRHADGSILEGAPPDGYKGQIIYTSNGYMSVQIFPVGRKWLLGTATREDLKNTLYLSSSYFGRYEVDTAASEVTHKVISNLDPSGETENYKRHYKLSGDELILTGNWEEGGEQFSFEVTWQRVK